MTPVGSNQGGEEKYRGRAGQAIIVAILTPPRLSIFGTRGRAGGLHPSGAPKTDDDLITLRQDRHPAVA
jgi:hypothetical protein